MTVAFQVIVSKYTVPCIFKAQAKQRGKPYVFAYTPNKHRLAAIIRETRAAPAGSVMPADPVDSFDRHQHLNFLKRHILNLNYID
jgi:hypothetical protein